MKKMIVLEIICFLLIGMFLYAAVSRWLDFKTFIADINNQPLPNQLTNWLVYIIPALQVLAALALVFEKFRLAGFWLCLTITLLYIIYNTLVLANYFGRIPCTCGGMIKHLTWTQHLIFSLFFAGISLTGIILLKNRAKSQQ
jgi:putative oxidoreductase